MDKVLIVDDDLEFLHTLEDGLQKYAGQFEVLTATNGSEAIDLLNKVRVSVLITDLDMPLMDGQELLTFMKKNRPQIPCVLMTDKGDAGITDEVRQSVFQCMEKPFDFNQLFAVIIEGLDRLDEGVFWKSQRK